MLSIPATLLFGAPLWSQEGEQAPCCDTIQESSPACTTSMTRSLGILAVGLLICVTCTRSEDLQIHARDMNLLCGVSY